MRCAKIRRNDFLLLVGNEKKKNDIVSMYRCDLCSEYKWTTLIEGGLRTEFDLNRGEDDTV